MNAIETRLYRHEVIMALSEQDQMVRRPLSIVVLTQQAVGERAALVWITTRRGEVPGPSYRLVMTREATPCGIFLDNIETHIADKEGIKPIGIRDVPGMILDVARSAAADVLGFRPSPFPPGFSDQA